VNFEKLKICPIQIIRLVLCVADFIIRLMKTQKIKIAHLEDNTSYAWWTRATLKMRFPHIEYQHFFKVKDLMTKIKSSQFNILLLDRNIDSENTIKRIKEILYHLPDLKIMLLSASGSSKDVATALVAGASHYFVKDSKLLSLSKVIRRESQALAA